MNTVYNKNKLVVIAIVLEMYIHLEFTNSGISVLITEESEIEEEVSLSDKVTRSSINNWITNSTANLFIFILVWEGAAL